MSGFVIEVSAAIELMPRTDPDAIRLLESSFYAPELIDVEFASVIRKLLLRGRLSEYDAESAVTSWSGNRVVRSPSKPFLQRIWRMKDNITPYDAAYVALAEYLEIPLLTADLRLAAAAQRYCAIATLRD
ncbi:type II toxin-antitoxin system VapC family toxin [Glaciihabitans sp. UYNi722]|uniref:type II toxin-antitoxin system VapC family toxin n=1 Tax=Glaciihabitans sp. UYNi722 TaxID=3156344 RepID=UPI003391F782